MNNIFHEAKNAAKSLFGRGELPSPAPGDLISPVMIKDATVEGSPGTSRVRVIAKHQKNGLYELRIQRIDSTNAWSMHNLFSKKDPDARYDMSPTPRTREGAIEAISDFITKYEGLGFTQEPAAPSHKKSYKTHALNV